VSYLTQFHPAVRKDLRRINPRAREDILLSVLPELQKDPYIGTLLTGPLRGIYKYRIFISGVWYRIAYSIDSECREIIVLAIGARGEFYDRLSRRLGK